MPSRTRTVTAFQDPAVARVFSACPPAARARLRALRALVLEVAAATPGVGEIEEALKWGEPAYLTSASRSGSTVRLGWTAKSPEVCRLLFHCQTHLVSTFRTLFGDALHFEGNRAIVLAVADPLPRDILAVCIAAALARACRTRRKLCSAKC